MCLFLASLNSLVGRFTRVGSSYTFKHETMLERLAKDKHFSLLQTFIDYGRKKLCNIALKTLQGKPGYS
jgi:hypothetical protein